MAAFNGGDWERLQAGLAADSRYEELGTARTSNGPEQIVELFKGWKQAFPDAVGTVTSAIASGETAWASRFNFRGTNFITLADQRRIAAVFGSRRLGVMVMTCAV